MQLQGIERASVKSEVSGDNEDAKLIVFTPHTFLAPPDT
jgi:hypothetical protein